ARGLAGAAGLAAAHPLLLLHAATGRRRQSRQLVHRNSPPFPPAAFCAFWRERRPNGLNSSFVSDHWIRYWTLSIMPRIAGVSCRTRSRPTRVSPRPRSVSRCFSVWPLIPRTSFTFSAISGSLRAHVGQLLAAQARRFLRAAQLAEAVES